MLIYPNPLNPKRYVVLNSGFTFREYDYLNNARQVPKLPDWAVIDVSEPPHHQPRDGLWPPAFSTNTGNSRRSTSAAPGLGHLRSDHPIQPQPEVVG